MFPPDILILLHRAVIAAFFALAAQIVFKVLATCGCLFPDW